VSGEKSTAHKTVTYRSGPEGEGCLIAVALFSVTCSGLIPIGASLNRIAAAINNYTEQCGCEAADHEHPLRGASDEH